MDRVTLKDVKGDVGACEDLYFTDSALMLLVSNEKGGIEQIIVGNKSGRITEADKLREEFFSHKNIEVEAGKLVVSNKSKAINRLFGDTVQIDGTIKINSEPKYTFYSVEKQGGFFPGYRIARLEAIK